MLVNGAAVSGCLYLAAFVDGADVATIEHPGNGDLDAVQRAFIECGAFQCGFCTPGFLVAADEILRSGQRYTRDELRELLIGHICRCTGYEPIIEAVYECLG